jgi:hypothetical protein
MLRVAANQAVMKMRASSDSIKEAGGESVQTGPAEYYVQGRYNGD